MYKNAIIISAFSCMGKTYLGNKYENILDLEASFYKWIYNDKELEKDVEKRKGVTDRVLNPNYPENYLKELEKNLIKYDIILITPEKKIREMLKEKDIPYMVAYPENPNFAGDRAIKRGNSIKFANGLSKSYNTWYPDKNEKVLLVSENEYLEDVLIKNEIIK